MDYPIPVITKITSPRKQAFLQDLSNSISPAKEIEELPEEIGILVKRGKLDADIYNLTSLPSPIGKSEKLVELHLLGYGIGFCFLASYFLLFFFETRYRSRKQGGIFRLGAQGRHRSAQASLIPH